MVAYIIIVIFGILIFFEGLVYAFFSDFTDMFAPIFFSGALSSYNTDESIHGYNILMVLFKYCLMVFLLYIALFVWQMSQKPERNW